jgi:dipeptidyl aminopeptidase/acylaminoacyl peptidase
MKYLIAFTMLFAAAACGHSPTQNDGHRAPAAYAKASDMPVEEFFRNADLFGYRISPDGKTLAVLRPWKNRMNIFVHPAAEPQNLKQITFVEDRDIHQVMWKGNDYVLFERDDNGDENDHVYAVNVKTGEKKDLTPFPKTKAAIADDLEEVSDTDVLIQHNNRDKEVFDVYRVNVQTGASQLVAENKNKMQSWLIDHAGNVRGGVASDGVNSIFYFEKSKGKGFEPVFKTGFRNEFSPVAFTADNKKLYVSTNLGRDLTSIVELDPSKPIKAGVGKVIFKHPRYDVGGASYSYVRKALGSVTVVTDRRQTTFLNAEDQKDWEFVKAQIGSALLANDSRDERIWVMKTVSDVSRGAYYLFDRNSRKFTLLGDVSPWIKPELMSEMKTVNYKTRDGLTVEGYLTVPRGREAKNLPVVVNPHGGPWARDEWGFNPEVQFLASRGYAVFQMNFRGSTGYGRKFWEKSFKQWGKTMQNDITDGVKWLEKKGYADANKICIYGASYGGYATLAGVAFTPDLYACAVDYVGVSNLFTFMKTIPPYWKPFLDMMYEMVGNPEKDKELLRSSSPVFFVDKIKTPLFVAQGANDPRVNKAESDQIVEGLRKRGVEVEYMVKENEGHGFSNEENRFDFYRAMEKFLAKHL